MAAIVKPEKCTGCGDCIEVCPCSAIVLKDKKAVINPKSCADCGACVDSCPTDAIEME